MHSWCLDKVYVSLFSPLPPSASSLRCSHVQGYLSFVRILDERMLRAGSTMTLSGRFPAQERDYTSSFVA
jgi:hypothetical protein